MRSVFIRKGHGYENGHEEGRCTAFDGFDIIARPLGGQDHADRERRVFHREGGRATTYASHVIALGKERHDGALYILMHHGAGREVLRVPEFYDGGELEAAILAMPERVQYALLYSIYQTASEARAEAAMTVRQEWKAAILEGRIRKHRATKLRGPKVEIISQSEAEIARIKKERAHG